MRIIRLLLLPVFVCTASAAGADDGSIVPASPTTPAAAPVPVRSAEPERPQPAPVDRVDAERETLARISNELLIVETMVREASHQAPSMARVQFRYDWLIADLELIERGLRDHLDAPRQPRPVVPLKGDYRH